MRRGSWTRWMRAVAALVTLAFHVSVIEARRVDDTVASSTNEVFHEEVLLRPLPDGKVAVVAHFRQEAPLAADHFETFPKAMAQIARASRIADMELSFTQGRWDYRRWGRPPVGAKPIGAELWASFHAPPSSTDDASAATDAADAGWNNLTALLSGQFCASLSRLRRTEVVVEPKLAFHPWDGSAKALAGGHPRRHGSLPAEAVCTENITPWIKLLPCRDQAGVGAMLRSRPTVFGAGYVSFTTRARVIPERKETIRKKERRGNKEKEKRRNGGGGGEGEGSSSSSSHTVGGRSGAWVLELTQAITLVLDAPSAATNGGNNVGAVGVGGGGGESGWWMSNLLGLGDGDGDGVRGACAVATSSAVHVETHRPHAVEPRGDLNIPPPRVHSANYDPVAEHGGPITLKSWDLTTMEEVGGGGGGGGSGSSGDRGRGGGGGVFDLHVTPLDEIPVLTGDSPSSSSSSVAVTEAVTGTLWRRRRRQPLRHATPQLYAERVVTGSGNHRGGLSIELRRPDEATDDRRDHRDNTAVRARLFQVLPWFVRVFIHTLSVEFDGVPALVPTSPSSSSSSSSSLSFSSSVGRNVEGIRWVPGKDRRRPSVLELQLLLPANASVARVYVGFEKSFLRVAEFPPDANRGFDLPAALLLMPPPPDLIRFNRGDGRDGGSSSNNNSTGGRDGSGSSSASLPPLRSPLLDAVEGLAAPPGDVGPSDSDGAAAATMMRDHHLYSGSDSRSHYPEAVYMGGLLLTLPTPDFSMPFNIITMVCTIMALLLGGLLGSLTRRPGWSSFAREKAVQRKKLAALAKKIKAEEKKKKKKEKEKEGEENPKHVGKDDDRST